MCSRFWPALSAGVFCAFLGGSAGLQAADHPGSNNRAADKRPVHITVRVPSPDAAVTFDGNATTQTGIFRSFQSPALEPGTYEYRVQARWVENGKPVTQSQNLRVHPGQRMNVVFGGPYASGSYTAGYEALYQGTAGVGNGFYTSSYYAPRMFMPFSPDGSFPITSVTTYAVYPSNETYPKLDRWKPDQSDPFWFDDLIAD